MTEARRFELLKLDYEMARDDDRALATGQLTMFGMAIALMAVIVPLFSQTCISKPDCNIPSWLVALVPMAPMALAGFLVGVGSITVIRSYYLRALEDELQLYADGGLSTLPIRPASLIGILTTVTSLRRGRGTYRLFYYMLPIATIAVFGSMTAFLVLQLQPPLKHISLVIYSLGIVLLTTEAMLVTIGGRSLFTQAIVKYQQRRSNLPELWEFKPPSGRSLVGYLLLPLQSE